MRHRNRRSAPDCEVQHALPSVEGGALSNVPSLIRHPDVPCARRVLVVSEDGLVKLLESSFPCHQPSFLERPETAATPTSLCYVRPHDIWPNY